MPYGVGIIGAGWVSGEHIKAFTRNPHTQVRGIFSRTPASAERKREEFGLDATVYTNLDALLADEHIQLVSICSASDAHAEQAMAAARAGKHIVIEKPIALNPEELWALERVVAETRVRTVVSFVLRWNPLFRTIKALLNDDTLGELFYASCDYWHNIDESWSGFSWGKTARGGGSSMLLAGCHAVDALRYFAGEVVEVTAYAAKPKPKSTFEFAPNVVASCRMANGGVGQVSSLLECSEPYIFNIDLHGRNGIMRNNRLISTKLPGQTGFAEIPTILPDSAEVAHHPFQSEIDHFVECIRDGRESHANVADAVKSHELCLAIDQSLATGRSVTLPLARP